MRTVLPQWILLVSGLVALACTAATHAAQEATPHIADCRIGFDGAFKVGHWTPIWVATAGDVSSSKLSIEVTTPDSDGVDVTIAAPVASNGPSAEGLWPTLLYVRAGRLGGNVTVKLVSENRRVLDRRDISAGSSQNGGSRFAPLPSTGELVLQLGPDAIGLNEVLSDSESEDAAPSRGVAQIADVDALPTDWFGYEGVDVLVLTTGNAAFCERLAGDHRRMAALRKWLELGGRLIVCAGRTAPNWFAEGKPFADLVPGKFAELVRLSQTQSLESFAGSSEPIGRSGVQQNIPVPRLVDVIGRVEVYGRGNDLPLVIRSARGLGELAFVGVDLAEPLLADWSGRKPLLQSLLRPYLDQADANRSKQKLVSLGYDDLAGALRQRLGRSFAGVVAIGFPLVAALVIGYIVLLGPLNYLLIEKLFRRPWVAWVTLPLVVLATSVGTAALLGAAKKTGDRRMNTAELVDIDLTTGRTRGTCWATLYSPQARRFDVALSPRMPGRQTIENGQTLVSWLGLPGSGIGGMHSAGEPIDVTGVGYRQSTNLEQLVGLPVLTSATKSLSARWDSMQTKGAAPPIAAELRVGDDGLVVGTLTNGTGAKLADACLLYGQWGYRLGDLQPGQRLQIGPELSAIRVKTIVARRARHGMAASQDIFRADEATADELLNVMMFYQVVGGEGFAGLPNRYQASCDLSWLLDLDRAILVASGTAGGSRWIDALRSESLESEPDPATVIYRFVLPVANGPQTNRPRITDN